MILDYVIVESDDKDILRKKVRELIHSNSPSNWKPLGGICVTKIYEGVGDNLLHYSQAMILERE
jgi:hypothetical protein